MTSNLDLEKTLDLPDIIKNKDLGFYGSYKVFSQYLGLKKTANFIYGTIMHAWSPKEMNLFPEFIISHNKKNSREYLDRQDQVDFLKKKGFKNVYCIGNPIIYFPKININRIKNSLLVMPQHFAKHTLEDLSKNDIAYTEFLKPKISKFDFVVLCLHPEDFEKGNYKSLRKLFRNIVKGAYIEDINGYERIIKLLCQFEYVTTNFFGSNVAYGAYFGCKVSVIGPQYLQKAEMLNYKFQLFKNVSKNENDALINYQNEIMQKKLPKIYNRFVCNPKRAKKNVKWGKWQLGEKHKKSPEELKKLLGLNNEWFNLYIIFRENKKVFIKRILMILKLHSFIKNLLKYTILK
jgi:hypothetical protein